VWPIVIERSSAESDTRLHDLINQVYEVTLTDGATPALLGRIAAFTGYEVAALVSTGNPHNNAICRASSGIDHAACEQAERDYGVSDSITRLHGREIRSGEFGFRDEFLAETDFRKLSFYHEFLVPNRLEHGAKLCLDDSGDSRTFINLARPIGRLSDQQRRHVLATLAPHLSRALQIQQRLAQTDALLHAYRQMGNFAPFPMLILDNAGAVYMSNRRIEELLPGDGLSMGRSGLRATLERENQHLQQAIRSVVAGTNMVPAQLQGTDLSISRSCGKRPYRLTIAPLSPAQEAAGRRPAAVVVVFDPEVELPLQTERMRALFGFTRAEAQVAIGIVQGKALDCIAASHGTSVATTRNLLKRVFVKAGVNRQSELAMVMLNSPLFFSN